MSNKSRQLMNTDENLLSICLTLHMHNTGASDPLPDEEVERLFHILNTAYWSWEDSQSFAKRFDEAVRHLIHETMCETDQ